ncbi:guanylate kinase [Candidatus Oleimmundimicrobium sp.]|uniref:guanylate kinase n=1 Tax=Candidatus Oleimmundimicrobium sp. TaxID=3060597 RepID=UPI00271A2A2F|nr:guanylate kinase [Candidatus Oleimmundimicrobium sp.]MDO8885410.1 guanylate kinase [Candidatus Oleimmundimicrobium sp.]
MKADRKLFVISGPSGTGKGTLISEIMKKFDDIELSVSSTTRKKRVGERPDLNYYFLSEEEFDKKIKNDEFLEWATVHSKKYGTLKDTVRDHLRDGNDVILELDVQGALKIKRKIPNSILIFIKPPSFAELRERLINRKTEGEEDIKHRLNIAKIEMKFANKYDYVIVNKDLKKTTEKLVKIIEQERRKKTTIIL